LFVCCLFVCLLWVWVWVLVFVCCCCGCLFVVVCLLWGLEAGPELGRAIVVHGHPVLLSAAAFRQIGLHAIAQRPDDGVHVGRVEVHVEHRGTQVGPGLVCLFVCLLFVCVFVCLPACVFVCLFACLFVCLLWVWVWVRAWLDNEDWPRSSTMAAACRRLTDTCIADPATCCSNRRRAAPTLALICLVGSIAQRGGGKRRVCVDNKEGAFVV
jgi:hypothetical protein